MLFIVDGNLFSWKFYSYTLVGFLKFRFWRDRVTMLSKSKFFFCFVCLLFSNRTAIYTQVQVMMMMIIITIIIIIIITIIIIIIT